MESRSVCIVLFVCLINAGAIKLFEKHHNKKISGNIAASYPVEGALDCEKLCLEMEDACAAVNVIYTNRRYVCDVMALFPQTDEPVEKQMTSNPKGKLIIKTNDLPNLCADPETYCEVSSVYDNYTCKQAIDGHLESGPGKEWVAQEDDKEPWINVTFPRLAEVMRIQVLHRCVAQDENKEMIFEFSDGSMITEAVECSENTEKLRCTELVPFNDINLPEAKKTKWIKLTGRGQCHEGGAKGLREVKYLGRYL